MTDLEIRSAIIILMKAVLALQSALTTLGENSTNDVAKKGVLADCQKALEEIERVLNIIEGK